MRLPSGVTVSEDQKDRFRDLASPLNLHFAAVAALALLCIYFAVRLLLVSGNTGAKGDEAIVSAQARVAASEIAARPMRGLETKLSASDAEAMRFYEQRLPFAYSDVLTQLGALTKKTNVRLARAGYVAGAPANGVTELRIDASVSGDYRSLAEFINGLERDRSFFLIENVVLSGAQNGLVNLQMRIGTWIREPMPNAVGAQNTAGGQP